MHGSEIFNEYQYSIYLDGHLKVIGEISKLIEKISDIGLALYNHPQRNDIYAEGMVVCNCGMGDANEVKRQLRRYMDEGMPIKYGLFMCGVIARDNRNKLADKIMHEWFYEYMRGERRDQLSFTYVLWKNGLTFADVGNLGFIEEDGIMKWMRHLKSVNNKEIHIGGDKNACSFCYK